VDARELLDRQGERRVHGGRSEVHRCSRRASTSR
jgi:hypothetical protein